MHNHQPDKAGAQARSSSPLSSSSSSPGRNSTHGELFEDPALLQPQLQRNTVVKTHYDSDTDSDTDNNNETRNGHKNNKGDRERLPLLREEYRSMRRGPLQASDHSLHTISGTAAGAPSATTAVTTRVAEEREDQDPTWEQWTIKHGIHPRTWTGQTYFKAALLCVFLALVIMAFTVFRVQDHVKDILLYIDDHRSIGALLFVLFYTIACWLFLPGSLFTIGAGFLFRPMPFALAIVIAGDVLGAVGSFLFGRYIFYDWVKGMMSKHPKFNALDNVIKDEGWKIVVMLRLTPIPFNLITYFFSITSIQLWTLVWATVVGVFPGSCLGIWIGSLLKGLSGIDNPELEPKNLVILAMNGVLIVCSILTLSIFGKRSLRKAMAQLDRHHFHHSHHHHNHHHHHHHHHHSHQDQSNNHAEEQEHLLRRDIDQDDDHDHLEHSQRQNPPVNVGSVTTEILDASLTAAEAQAQGTDLDGYAPIAQTTTVTTGFTRGEKMVLFGILIAIIIDFSVCIPLYLHFANQTHA